MGGRGLRRGGVLAGAAALLAGALATAVARVARAADGEPLLLGRENAATGTTELDRSDATAEALRVTNGSGAAVVGESRGLAGTGVVGLASARGGTGVIGFGGGGTGVGGSGVFGVYGSGSGVGVTARGRTGVDARGGDVGLLASGPVGVRGAVVGGSEDFPGIGVHGLGAGPGAVAVRGEGVGGTGVLGTGATGVRGDGGAAGIGVAGSAAGGAGLVGVSATGTGVHGESPAGSGLVGASATGTGVWAACPEGIALYAASAAYLAAHFDGPVEVNGPLVVRGDLAVVGAPAAAAAAPDGSLRRLYALASPEGWVEDFGEGQLTGGAAQVRLDPELAALTRGDAYHVFLTAYGDTPGLYVGARGPGGFEVRERPGGPGGTAFGYRVVARRRAAPGPPLERVPPRPACRRCRPRPSCPRCLRFRRHLGCLACRPFHRGSAGAAEARRRST